LSLGCIHMFVQFVYMLLTVHTCFSTYVHVFVQNFLILEHFEVCTSVHVMDSGSVFSFYLVIYDCSFVIFKKREDVDLFSLYVLIFMITNCTTLLSGVNVPQNLKMLNSMQ